MDVIKQAQWRQDVSSAIEDLRRRIGRCPNASELADDLEADRDEVVEEVLRIRASASAVDPVGILPKGGQVEPALIESIGRLERELAESVNIGGLSSILDLLSTEERAVVVLKLARSQGQSLIAEQLQITPRAVAEILARALTFLRDRV